MHKQYYRPGLDFAMGLAVEEMGELNAAIGKSMRWGLESSNPELPEDKRELNKEWIRREANDVLEAMHNLLASLDMYDAVNAAQTDVPTWEGTEETYGPGQELYWGPDVGREIIED